MAIPIEGFTVVAKRERIQPLLDNEQVSILNATTLADDDIWRCSFMTLDDATAFIRSLEELDLNASVGPDSDAVLVNEFDCSIYPYCEWLLTARYERAVIAWLAGTEPRTIIARDGWDPKVGSGLTFREGTEGLELVRVDGNVEVYRDRESGKEGYVGRTSAPVNGLFESAGQIIKQHWHTVGEPPLRGAAAKEVQRASAMLDTVLAEVPDNWRVFWLHGKAQLALGHVSVAHASFERAFELEKNEQAIARELAGTCLELGKFAQAVEVALRAVSLHPDNAELLGNLAVAQLLAGDVDAANTTLHAATRRNPTDPVNLHLRQVILDIVRGKRRQPRSMQELQRVQPKRFWEFWK